MIEIRHVEVSLLSQFRSRAMSRWSSPRTRKPVGHYGVLVNTVLNVLVVNDGLLAQNK